MRFSVLVAGAFAAIASAQSTAAADTTPAVAPTQTYSMDPAQSSIYSCLDKCEVGDVECQSHCITVPAPNDQQANDTVNCVAECPQGDGSEAETKKFEECTQACIKKHYYDESEGTPKGTGAANNGGAQSSGAAAASDATKTGSAAASDATETGSATDESTASGTSAATTAPTNAAPAVAVGSAALLGLVAAVLAL